MTSSTRCPLSLWLVLLVVLGAATRAYAQPTPTDDAAARTHFSQGQVLSSNGDFAGAYREFEAGYKANPKPAFLFNMGEAARGMGDSAAARAAYERFLAIESTGALADTARARLDELMPSKPVTTPPRSQPKVPAPADLAKKMNESPNGSVVGTPLHPSDEPRPLWKKWPFWAVVGGAVVTGVVVGVVATRGNDVSCGTNCADFRP